MKGKRSRLRAAVSRGQTLVEFSLVGVILFLFIFGIIDAGRLLFTYSVVSNASQEGSHYGITRPRDVLDSVDATRVAQNVTRTPQADRHTYIPAQVVPTPVNPSDPSPCNIFAKTREKAFGVPSSDVNVAAWYDNGDGTPIPVATPVDLETAAVPGHRVVVEASYRFYFLTPFISIFKPNGINVKMRSARTILTRGDDPAYVCMPNYTPAPTYTPGPSPTLTPRPTPTP